MKRRYTLAIEVSDEGTLEQVTASIQAQLWKASTTFDVNRIDWTPRRDQNGNTIAWEAKGKVKA